MSVKDLTKGICYDNFYINDTDVAYDVRVVLFVVTNLLAPGYIILSVVAVVSRYNSFLKELASHGKTSTNDSSLNSSDTTQKIQKSTSSFLSWPAWCWVSKRRFVHFYFVGLLSTAIATTICYSDCYYEKIHDHHIDGGILGEMILSRMVAVVLLVIHIVRRSYECLYIHQHSEESSKMHIAGYALGVGYYTVLPLVFWDIDGNTTNSVSFGSRSDENHFFGLGSICSSTSITSMILILGMSSFNIWMQYEQHVHHIILADIRRVGLAEKRLDDEKDDGGNRNLYQNPPYQRWFCYVLSPHYLAEVLLYFSFAILLEIAAAASVQNNSECESVSHNFGALFIYGRIVGSLSVWRRYRHWMLFVWVATNLTVSAMNSYDWYDLRCKGNSSTSDNTATNRGNHRRAENRYKRRAIFPKIW